ncbi:MAG TPA: hypothetical protein VN381_11575 [Anaerovoracaceae bacterium]|nr:hypothetical protein [Anaerovoracaceae bacterium]
MGGFGTKEILILLLSAVLTLSFFGCGGNPSDAEEPSEPEQDPDNTASAARVDYGEDAFDLMGLEYQSFLADLNDGMVAEFLDGESAGVHEAAYYYVLNNGTEVSISADGYVIAVRTLYNMETKYPVPVLKGIGGEDTYDDAVEALGKPYYEGSELAGEDEKEFYAAVFYAGSYRYLKVYFDSETKYVLYISCFYAEPPIYDEMDGIKVGDSLGDLKAVYDKLYYETAYYDPASGEPKHNRIYYTPMEDRDRGVECLVFYMQDKKVVKITTKVQDILEWRNYEDIFGRKDVFKEDNMVGHSGNIVYFYDDASGNEQVLLKVENCATEEIDLDADGITEIIAYYSIDNWQAMDIYDYDPATDTILHLDLRETLGAISAGYMGNAANVKYEYSKCISAGFKDSDGKDRFEVYSVKDNVLTYIGPQTQEMYQ